MFVTLFLGVCNVKSGEFTYTNAGHNPPYIKRANGEIECVDQLHGPIAGAMGEVSYKQDKLGLQKGDLLYMFTDGVSEAMDIDANLFGEQRIIDYLSGMGSNEPRLAVGGIGESVEKFAGIAPQSDDITALAMRFDQAADQVNTASIDLTITNELSEVSGVVGAFELFSEESGIPMSVATKFSLVIDDLLSNIVFYAFPTGGEHQIRICVEKTDDRVLLTVEDDGVAFNPFSQAEVNTDQPLEDREIGGLGIHLIKNIMDEVSYKRHRDHNVVTLIKKLVR
jgi:sigma-B regulation protein RsbU (phosphoserine phosphatase)